MKAKGEILKLGIEVYQISKQQNIFPLDIEGQKGASKWSAIIKGRSAGE
jgi:hypothetical protein